MRFAFALLSALALAASTAQAATVVGINSAAEGGGLYSIDTDTGLAVKIADTPGLGTGINDGNGLAADQATRNFYYSSFGGGNSKLFAYNVDSGTTTTAGTLSGPVASGTFAQGHYWYFTQATGVLHQVTFNAAGDTIVSDTTIALSGDVKNWSFGDIDIRGNTLFGIANAGGANELFSVDLATGVATTIATEASNFQVVLAGALAVVVNTTNGNLFSIDLNNGNTSALATIHTASGQTLRINDFSATAIPEPSSVALLGIGLTGFFSLRRRFLSKGKVS